MDISSYQSIDLTTIDIEQAIDTINVDESGVYMLCKASKPIYVNKCSQLSVDVLNQWQDRFHSGRLQKIWKDADQMIYKSTSTAFEALKQVMQLKQTLSSEFHKPVVTHRLLFSLRFDVSGETFSPPKVVPIKPSLLASKKYMYIGVFGSVIAAKKYLIQKVKTHKLCLKTLGLESAQRTACFARQVNRCFGACDGGEPLPLFTQRFLHAVVNETFPRWHFDKALALYNEITSSYSVFAYGVYLGEFAYKPTEQEVMKTLDKIASVDLAEQNIVHRYLNSMSQCLEEL